MTTAQMEYFIQAANLGSFTAAAESLYMTQPGLSHHISSMEKELGVKLFLRGNNSVRLTPAGHVLYEGLKTVLEEYHALLAKVENIALGIMGEFRIGILEDLILDDLIAQVVKKLKAANPEINISIQRQDINGLMDGLRRGALDVGITLMNFLRPSNFQIMKLPAERLYLAISKTNSIGIPDCIGFDAFMELLESFSLILINKNNTSDTPLRDAASRPLVALNERSCHPFVNLVSSFDDLCTQVAAGLGVLIVNRTHMISNDPRIRLIELDFDMEEKHIWPDFQRAVIWCDGAENPILDSFISILSADIAQTEPAL